MLRTKISVSIVSIALIYYGASTLYSLFSHPGGVGDKGGSQLLGSPLIPGACALVGGLILAFGCIFWLSSELGRRPRRYVQAHIPPPVTQHDTPRPVRTLADDASRHNQAPMVNGRPRRAISGAPSLNPGNPGAKSNANGNGRRKPDIMPPMFDPYEGKTPPE